MYKLKERKCKEDERIQTFFNNNDQKYIDVGDHWKLKFKLKL